MRWIKIGLQCVGLAALLLQLDWAGESLVSADVSTANLSVSCVDPVVLAFTPNIHYTMTIPAVVSSSAFSPAAVTATASLSNAVNSDNPTPAVTVGSTGNSQQILLYNNGPYVKIGGVQCSANSRAQLEVHGDGADDTVFDVALETPSDTTWQDGSRVDNAPSATPKTIFGPGGVVYGDAISDGSDADGIVNGEIAFGGNGSVANGGYRLMVRVQYIAANPTSAGETLTFVFTPL